MSDKAVVVLGTMFWCLILPILIPLYVVLNIYEYFAGPPQCPNDHKSLHWCYMESCVVWKWFEKRGHGAPASWENP